jgi:hypothetical protein
MAVRMVMTTYGFRPAVLSRAQRRCGSGILAAVVAQQSADPFVALHRRITRQLLNLRKQQHIAFALMDSLPRDNVEDNSEEPSLGRLDRTESAGIGTLLLPISSSVRNRHSDSDYAQAA